MNKKIFKKVIMSLMLVSTLIGCGSKNNQKQTPRKKINYRERLDSIKTLHTNEGYVLFEKFDEKDSYIIYATNSGIYKETVWGETTTLLDDAETQSFNLKTIGIKKWSPSPSGKGLSLPYLDWEDYIMEDEPGDASVFYVSGGLICAIKEGVTSRPWDIKCNEAGVKVDDCLFLFDSPNVFYVSSGVKVNGDSDFYKFKASALINIKDFPDLPNDIYSLMDDYSLPYECTTIEWPFKIAPSGNINQNNEEFYYKGKTCSLFSKEMFCEKVEKSVKNHQQERIERIVESSIKLDEFTRAYQKNPIKAEQIYPVGSKLMLLVDVNSITKSDNPYYKYLLRSTSGIVDAYSFIYTNDDSFAAKDYPIGCCMEATFTNFDGVRRFEFENADAKAFGPTSYQNDYDY